MNFINSENLQNTLRSKSEYTENEIRDMCFNYWQMKQREYQEKRSQKDSLTIHKTLSSHDHLLKKQHKGTSLGHDTPYLSSSERGSNGSSSPLLLTPITSHFSFKNNDFVITTCAFILGPQSLWHFPLLVSQQGGLVFLLVYFTLMALFGFPLLVLEMKLGQFSGLSSPLYLYQSLCPMYRGLGLCVILANIFDSLKYYALLSWSGKAVISLWTQNPSSSPSFFLSSVVSLESSSSLENLGPLNGGSALSLGLLSLLLFSLTLSDKALGKVSLSLLSFIFALTATLAIRVHFSEKTETLSLLSPSWPHLKDPKVWFEASKYVFTSLTIGLGVIPHYASRNNFHHNILRDAGWIVLAQVFWTLLSGLLSLSLLGLAKQKLTLIDEKSNFWFFGLILIDSGLNTLNYNWLWSSLLFIILILLSLGSLVGNMETLTFSILSLIPSCIDYKVAISFSLLCLFTLLSLLFSTSGGIYIYTFLYTYVTLWPPFLIALLTSFGASLCLKTQQSFASHGSSKSFIGHSVVLYISNALIFLLPLPLSLSLGWILSQYASINDTKTSFMGFFLASLPLFFLVLGVLYQLFWKGRNKPFILHVKSSFKPHETWYENEKRENLLNNDFQNPQLLTSIEKFTEV